MKTKLIFAAVALAASSMAQADSIADYVKWEIGAGFTRYNLAEDGRWYQSGMQHNRVDASAPALSIGLTGPLYSSEKWGVDWHADYVNLGRMSSDCVCTSDENYDNKAHRMISAEGAALARFQGAGRAQGIALTIEPYYLYRSWRFGVEAGLFVYRPQWDVHMQTIAPDTNGIIDPHTPNNPQIGRVVGASVGKGPWRVAYRHYFLPTKYDATHYPAIYTGADVVEVKYVGNFF